MADECSSKANSTSTACSTNKWECAICTYLNWSTASKCAMCYQARIRPMLIEEISAIDDVATPRCASAEAHNPIEIEQSLDEKRWPCPSCTYKNCRRTKKCTICGEARPSPYGSDSVLNESPKIQQHLNKMLNKWSCSACTFDNWPTSAKCTICGADRAIGADGSAQVTTSRHSPISSKGEQIADKKVASNQCDQEAERLGQLHICKNSAVTPKTDHASALEIYIRRFLGNDPVEKFFFKAVSSIGNQEIQMVNRVVDFLINEGNLTRSITSFESRLLNQLVSRGASNRVIRFERADSILSLASNKSCSPDLLKLIRRVKGDSDKLPCSLDCNARTRLYRQISQFVGIRDTGLFKAQYFAHPYNFNTLNLPIPANDLGLAVQHALFHAAPSIPPQFCYVDCFDSMASIGGQLCARPVNFLMKNRGGAYSLYDSVFQSMFGVCDRFSMLREALKFTMHRSAHLFKPRWVEQQLRMGKDCGVGLKPEELDADWEEMLNLLDEEECASDETIHIFALAHVVCRPIIVFSMDEPTDVEELLSYNKYSACSEQIQQLLTEPTSEQIHRVPQQRKGERPLRQANPQICEGIYLPVLWGSPPITRSPLILCHRNGQFHYSIVSDAVYQRDHEVQRYIALRRSLRRPGTSEPLFRFLTRAEQDNPAFLGQFLLFGDCSISQLTVRREPHPCLQESLLLYRQWCAAMVQINAESGHPCTMATPAQLEMKMDSLAQKKRKNPGQSAALAAIFQRQQRAGAKESGGEQRHSPVGMSDDD